MVGIAIIRSSVMEVWFEYARKLPSGLKPVCFAGFVGERGCKSVKLDFWASLRTAYIICSMALALLLFKLNGKVDQWS